MNKNNIKTVDLKNYCKYLIEEYTKVCFGNGGNVMIRLTQFYDEGRVKDIVDLEDSNKTKAMFLSLTYIKISSFIKENNVNHSIKSFKKFLETSA